MKKSIRKQLIVVVVVMIAITVIFSGCAKETAPEPTEVKETETTSDEQVTAEPTEEMKEPVEILWAIPVFGAGSINDSELIQEAVNEIALSLANVKADLEFIPFGSYNQQMTLMLSGNEKLDIMLTLGGDIATYANRSQILGLNDLIDEYGQGLKENLGDYLNATRIEGEVYAVPTIRDFCRGGGFNLRTDLLEKYEIDLSAIKSLEDMTPVFEKIKNGEGEDFTLLILNSQDSSFLDWYIPVDRLTDGNGVLLDRGQGSPEVVLYEESQVYSDMVNLFHDWYEAGYVQKDIVTSQETNASLLRAGIGFGSFSNCKPGTVENNERSSGVDLTNIQILPYGASTSDVNNICWAIAQNSEVPAAAMKFMNLMYTNEEIETIMTWGIEGTHYVMNDEGFATYPEGVTAENSGYTLNLSWLMGNQFLTPHWEGERADLWDLQKAANDSAIKSQALGFNFDNSNVKSEVAACEAVRSEYKMQIETGAGDVPELLPKYIEALKAAGIEKIIAEKQAQLDTWMAANK